MQESHAEIEVIFLFHDFRDLTQSRASKVTTLTATSKIETDRSSMVSS